MSTMDLNNVVSQLDAAAEPQVEALLQQYNREVSRCDRGGGR